VNLGVFGAIAGPVPGAPQSSFRPTIPESRLVALRVDGLHKAFHSGNNASLANAVSDVSLHACSSEILGICGASGSGKTTLLRCIAGLMRADTGRILWFGSRFRGGGCLPGLSYVPNAPDYYPFLTARDALEYHVDRDIAGVGRAHAILAALHSVGLAQFVDSPVRAFDQSKIAALAVAEALASSPRAIVVDSTLDAIEPRQLLAVDNALSAFAIAGGTAIVASRRIEILTAIASRTLWIEAGMIGGEPARLVAERKH
jgi:ABC-2 type transport system ATP-binding protein